MDLILTVKATAPTVPDPEQIAALIPRAFAQLAGGSPDDITVTNVTVETVPVHFAPLPPNVPAPNGPPPVSGP